MRNPQCQKLHNINGVLRRCRNLSYLVHHITGARLRPDLFLSVFDENGKSNLVALCSACHPAEAQQTNHWQETVEGAPVPPGQLQREFFARTEWNIHL